MTTLLKLSYLNLVEYIVRVDLCDIYGVVPGIFFQPRGLEETR